MRRKRLMKGSQGRSFDYAAREGLKFGRCCEEAEIGQCLRALREECGHSLRSLADQSGLSVNTISLIENGKTSPSVSTLQKISAALKVPLVTFFLSGQVVNQVIYTEQRQRKQFCFEHGVIEDLGESLSNGALEPFVVTLDPGTNSGIDPIMHSGYEFVYCLQGRIAYVVENTRYILEPGDSLFFESHLPHCWQNLSAGKSQKLLVLCPSGNQDDPVDRHFTP